MVSVGVSRRRDRLDKANASTFERNCQAMVRAYEYEKDGDKYRVAEVTRPEIPLGPDQVRIRMRAASLNYRDLIQRGNLAGRNVAGKVPLSDGAGGVVAVGSAVTEWRLGDRVAACFFPTWQRGRFDLAHHKADLGGSADGVLADEIVLPASAVVRVPDHLTFAQAACLPCAGVTAWQSLFSRGQLQAGETVLVQGTGGVSIFALQFAVAAGATVFVTSSSEAKLAKARQLGATHTINYRSTPDWDQEVWRLSERRGVDHLVEVGGPGTLGKSMQCVAAGGQIALVGVLTGFGPSSESLFPLLARNVRLDGIYVGSRAMFEEMNRFLAKHQIVPVIDRSFPFAAAAEAFDYLAQANHLGKVVIEWDEA